MNLGRGHHPQPLRGASQIGLLPLSSWLPHCLLPTFHNQPDRTSARVEDVPWRTTTSTPPPLRPRDRTSRRMLRVVRSSPDHKHRRTHPKHKGRFPSTHLTSLGTHSTFPYRLVTGTRDRSPATASALERRRARVVAPNRSLPLSWRTAQQQASMIQPRRETSC